MSEQSLTDDLKPALDEALREVGMSNDVMAKSVVLYDMSRAVFKAGLTEVTDRVVEEARKLTADIPKETSEESRVQSYMNICKALAITEPPEKVAAFVAAFPVVTRVQMADRDVGGALMTVSESIPDDTDDVLKALALIPGINDDEQRG